MRVRGRLRAHLATPGVVFSGANASAIDGYDVAFAKLLLGEMLGVTPAFLPYPDSSSMYVGLRNDECDFAISAVELDASRVRCEG
jgi:hypothetical protein